MLAALAQPTDVSDDAGFRELINGLRLTPAAWLGHDGTYVLDATQLPTGSFKVIPGYQAVLAAQNAGATDVIAVSAGNFGAGVARAGQERRIPVTVIAPRGTSPIKITNIQSYGATVVICGTDIGEAIAYAETLSTRTGATLLHPFDRPEVIAANAAIGRRLIGLWGDQCRAEGRPIAAPRRLIAACGGGGLTAGVFSAVWRDWPGCHLIAAEPEGAASLTAALAAKHPVDISPIDTWAAGAAVNQVGEQTFAALSSGRDGHPLVTRVEVVTQAAAHRAAALGRASRLPVEAAAALTYAVALASPVPDTIVVASGRNDALAGKHY